MSKEEEEILSLIESLIKKGNANIVQFTTTLIKELKKIVSNDKLKSIIEKRLSEKKIYFIRHPEAEHNVLERKYNDFKDYNIYDPKLTKKGKEQTNLTKEKLKKKNINFDSVYVSPLTRAIETYNLIKGYLNKDAKIYCTDFVKEVVSYMDKNKGKTLSTLKKELKDTDINLDYITKEYWWYDLGENKDNESEGKQNFGLRMRIFILWIIFRPEKNILIISHSHVHCELQDEGIYNADLGQLNNMILLKKVMQLINITIKSD